MGAAAVGIIWFGARVIGGLFAGGGLIYLNLLWIAALVRELLGGQASRWRFGLKAVGKALLLYGAVGSLIALDLVDPVAFLVGISGLAVSILIVGLRWQYRQIKGGAGEK